MFPYMGGKSQQVKRLEQIFTKSANSFIDVFGGAGWVSVTTQIPLNPSVRVYNDFNPFIANILECARKSTTDLVAAMDQYQCSDELLFKQFQDEIFNKMQWQNVPFGDFDLAARYLYIQTQIFSSQPLNARNKPYFPDVHSNGRDRNKYDVLKSKLKNNKKVKTRLSELTTVENMDCCDVIRKYDGPDTFFYVDPPYYNMEFNYTLDFPIEKHTDLANVLSSIEGKFALSYYDTPEIRQLYPSDKFLWVNHKVSQNSSNSRKVGVQKVVNEIVIMNYDPLFIDTNIFEIMEF